MRRGLARDADVVLEVVNGIAFLTPLWLRNRGVTLVHHIHRDHYVTELGRVGAVAALVAGDAAAEAALRRRAVPDDLARRRRPTSSTLGVPEEDVHVGYLGVVPFDAPLPERGRRRRGCSTSGG